MYSFDFLRPTTLAEAAEALARDEALALGGGQTLIPTLKQRLASPSVLVSLGAIAEMKGICRNDAGQICIGGGTTHATVAAELAESYPAMAALAGQIGDPAVRNRGTIGGSLANNDPAACYPAGVLGSKSLIVTNTREIAVDDFFQGMFTTDLESCEIITEVRVAVPDRANYQKFVQPASRFAMVGGVCRAIQRRCARGGHGRITRRRVPLDRGRGRTQRSFRCQCAGWAVSCRR